MLKKIRKLCIEAGMRFSVPWQTGFLGHARVMAGEVEAGIALPEEACEIARRSTSRQSSGYS
jgi:hypothetical protein